MGNIYEKLQECRVLLQNKKLKKSGFNSHANYKYFELSDFLPEVNELFHEKKLFSQISFTKEIATLMVINAEKPDESIIFTSPMGQANRKGTEIQDIGSQETYSRRYLYMTALEIVENDALDATLGKEKKSTSSFTTYEKKATENQVKALESIIRQEATKRNMTKEDVIKKMKIEKLSDLSSKEASEWIKKLKS